jgi:pimeloyl-ACP methyl ester carboxylesterase
MISLLPNGRIHIIENAGHISTLEQPEQVNAALLEFLSNHLYENPEVSSISTS